MLSEAASTLSPLPSVLSKGLITVSFFSLLSFLCCTTLFLYLTYRLISWHLASHGTQAPNQFLILIYNLLLADIQQACAFLLNIVSLKSDAIMVGTKTCWAQGWFVSTGDLASSMFILSIALHTFMGVVKDYRLPSKVFYGIIAFNWFFVYFMGAIGPLIHGEEFYTRASAWCWINEAYSTERLWLHYFWIFLAMFSTIIIYVLIYISLLRRPSLSSSRSISPMAIPGTSASPLMILYPLIYTVCTAPLAGGRIYALAGHKVSLAYFCVAGTMISCNGWLDVLLYATTRAEIVFSEEAPGEEVGLETFAFMGKGHRLGTTTTIEAGVGERVASRLGKRRGSRKGSRRGSGTTSQENLYGLNQIGIKGEVTVSVDVAYGGPVGQERLAREASVWDNVGRESGKSFDSSRIR